MAVLVFQLLDAVPELAVDQGQVAAGGAQRAVLADGLGVPAAFARLVDQPGNLPQRLVQLGAG